MKGKYISTSLLLAVMASERTTNMEHQAETKASTEDHELIWSKNTPSAKQLKARLEGRDELKLA